MRNPDIELGSERHESTTWRELLRARAAAAAARYLRSGGDRGSARALGLVLLLVLSLTVTHIYIYIYNYVCMYYVCMYYVYISLSIYIYIYICMYIYVYIYIYIYYLYYICWSRQVLLGGMWAWLPGAETARLRAWETRRRETHRGDGSARLTVGPKPAGAPSRAAGFLLLSCVPLGVLPSSFRGSVSGLWGYSVTLRDDPSILSHLFSRFRQKIWV